MTIHASPTLDNRIYQVRKHLEENDLDLGFRKLLDVVMETDDMALFYDAIAVTQWRADHTGKSDAAFVDRCNALLQKVNKSELSVFSSEAPVLRAEAVEKTYDRSKFKLGPVSLTIARGKVYGLVGENGNGKTTLLRLLAGELNLSKGTLDYHFEHPPETDYDLRTKLVYVPQRTATWYGSLLDNLRFVLSCRQTPPEEIEPRVLVMVARLGLWNYRKLKWSELSSGYKMRFELARTLLQQPEIMLLDEPLANLDVLAQQVILEDLKAIGSSLTRPIAMVLSSQQLYEVEKISDRVIFLKNGVYNPEQSASPAGVPRPLVVEIETPASKAGLQEDLAGMAPEEISYNGGVYVVRFRESVTFNSILEQLGKGKSQITYIRNITHSTRRFFVA